MAGRCTGRLAAGAGELRRCWRAAGVAFGGPSRTGTCGAAVPRKPRDRRYGLCRAPSHAAAAREGARRAGRRAALGLDRARAPLWGLVRAAQSEHPGRLALLDIDTAVSEQAWHGALGCEEPQLGLRQDKLCAPRLARPGPDQLLVPEGGAPWSVQISTRGSLDNLVVTST